MIPVTTRNVVVTRDALLASRDAFGRSRVSQPETLFDCKQLFDNAPTLMSDAGGAGTTSVYQSDRAATTITVPAGVTGSRVRQSFQRMVYQPGKSQLSFLTFRMPGAVPVGGVRKVGLFDGTDGLYLKQDSTGASFVILRAGLEEVIPQNEWNVDRLDGLGDSRFTLDLDKVQILMIDFEWLGVGSVRFGFVIDGVPLVCHIANHANRQTTVYMNIPNLPVRYEVTGTGTGDVAMDTICASVMSEGGSQFAGFMRSADTGAAGFTSLNDASLYPILALRIGATGLRGTAVALSSVMIGSASANSFRWALLLNPTIAGTALSFSAVPGSRIEVANPSNATTISAEGLRFSSGFIVQTAGGGARDSALTAPLDVRLGVSIAGVSDVLVLAAQRTSGTGALVYQASLTWQEST